MSVNKNITGSVRPRPNKNNVKYYDVILELGKDALTGQRLRTTFRCDTNNRKEAENFLLIKKAEYLSGDMLMPSERTVEQFMKEYLQNCIQEQYSPATYNDYKGTIERYIIPVFGNIKLQDLKRIHIQKAYNDWKTKSNLSNDPLKAATIKHINRIFKAALNVAVDEEYIKQNPTSKIKIGKDLETVTLDVYTVEEIRMLKKAVKDTDMELPVALLFDCIMRRGELLGLSYDDIDFKTKSVTIRHAYVESADSKCPVLKDCKTEGSSRKLIVSDYTIKLLKKQRACYMENKLKYGSDFCDSNRVICQKKGKPYLPKSFYTKWVRTLKAQGLRHMKLHGTRHSAISLLMSEGVPLHLVQQRAGHQDPKITLAIYAHVAKDNQEKVADVWNSILDPASNQ